MFKVIFFAYAYAGEGTGGCTTQPQESKMQIWANIFHPEPSGELTPALAPGMLQDKFLYFLAIRL